MHNSKTQETLVGFFVASGIVALFFMAMQISNLSSFSDEDVYSIKARFDNSGGLKVKSAVTISGVRVGRVTDIYIDTEDYVSVVQMDIEKKYRLSDDTFAKIYTAGLLGEQYVSLDPGGSEDYLKENDVIEHTQPAVVLEEIIGQLITKDEDGK